MDYLNHFTALKKLGFKPEIDVDIDLKSITDLGIKVKVSLKIDELGTNTAVDFISDNLLKKRDINETVSKLTKELIKSFGIKLQENESSKVTNIDEKREEKKENENEKILKSELTEEDMNNWTPKSCIFYASDVSKLSNLKSKLKIKTNDELLPYINEFLGGQYDRVGVIIPKNIEDFNQFLEKKAESFYEEGGRAG